MFSKSCEYGIKASLFVAQQALRNESKIGVKEIAKGINSPEAFTAKILQTLTRKNIIHSVKGPTGGFYIPDKKLSEIKLSQIVKAIDGDEIYKSCGLGLEYCSDEKPCPLHFKFKGIRLQLEELLTNTTLLDLALGLDLGLTFLKR